MAEFTQQERPKILELQHWGLLENGSDFAKRGRLAWSIRDGYPRITIFTNKPDDTLNYGILSAPMSPGTMFTVLDLLEQLAKGENNKAYRLQCMSLPRENGVISSQEKIVNSVLGFGKDVEGLLWISVVAPPGGPTRPQIKFYFKFNDFDKFLHGDGTPFTEAEGSKYQCIAAVHALRNIYSSLTGGFKQPKNGMSNSYSTPATSVPTTALPSDFENDVLF